jgi:hypothetical protein
MSQPELERTLRPIRPVAPPELRERVRMLAAQPLPARGLDRWRRPLALAIPLAAALAAALVAVLARDHGSRPESSPAAKSSPLEASRAAAPRVADQAAGAAAPEQAVVALARSLDGTVVSRRLLAHAVELRLRFPRGQARGALRRLVALPGTVRVDLTPHNARDADTVVVRVSRP